MATALGMIEIGNVAVGSSAATALALGDVVVWQLGPEPVAGPWLCFTAEQSNSTATLSAVGSPDAVSLETSEDGSSWSDYTVGDTLALASVGDKLYMRAKTENSTFSKNSSNYYIFVMEGSIAASGNVQSLLKADCTRTDAPAYCYTKLFRNCSSLTTAPALPATTLNSSCYSTMFQSCKSMTDAPELPATTLSANCYYNMFYNCNHLSSVNVAFTEWNPSNATTNWLNGAAAEGTFTCPSGLDTTTQDNSHVPAGWTVVKY